MTIRLWQGPVLGMILSACAASPQKPPVAVAASLAVSASQKPVVPNRDIVELDRRARQMGYHVVMMNSERRYCQYGAPVGSHISQLHCLSVELMAQAAREDEEIHDKLSQRGKQLCPSCVQKN